MNELHDRDIHEFADVVVHNYHYDQSISKLIYPENLQKISNQVQQFKESKKGQIDLKILLEGLSRLEDIPVLTDVVKRN